MRLLSYLILAAVPVLIGLSADGAANGLPPAVAPQDVVATTNSLSRAVQQARTGQTSPASQAEADLSDRLREVQRRNYVLEARSELEDTAYARIEILIGALGGLLTVLVVGFGIATYRTAANAARQEIADVMGKVQGLQKEAEAATAQAVDAATSARDSADSAQVAAQGALVHQQTAKEASEEIKEAAAIAKEQLSGGVGKGARAELSEAERETVTKAASELADKPEGELSADEFRVKILEANDRQDWAEVLRLGRGMEFLHNNDASSMAFALFNQGAALQELGQLEAASAAYQELDRRLGGDNSESVQDTVGMALVNRGTALGDLGRFEEAVDQNDQVIERVRDKERVTLRGVEAKALFNKAWNLEQLGQVDAAISSYDAVVERFQDFEEPDLLEDVAKALVNKGAALPSDQAEEANVIYEEVERRFKDQEDPRLRRQVAMALVNRARRLFGLGRVDEAISAFEDIIQRFDGDEATALSLVRALLSKAFVLGHVNRTEEEEAIYREIVSRFGSSTDPNIRTEVANVLLNSASVKAHQGKIRACIAALEQWKKYRGSFDCEAIAGDPDFDPIRDRPSFRHFLRQQGCEFD